MKPGKQRKDEGDDSADVRNQRKTSLKLGTGRKGRSAEVSGRRGSLKKRDRSAEKEAKAAAAEERRTVRLPEYVYHMLMEIPTVLSFFKIF